MIHSLVLYRTYAFFKFAMDICGDLYIFSYVLLAMILDYVYFLNDESKPDSLIPRVGLKPVSCVRGLQYNPQSSHMRGSVLGIGMFCACLVFVLPVACLSPDYLFHMCFPRA